MCLHELVGEITQQLVQDSMGIPSLSQFFPWAGVILKRFCDALSHLSACLQWAPGQKTGSCAMAAALQMVHFEEKLQSLYRSYRMNLELRRMTHLC